ncbi:MAG: hypothetical protein ACI96M_004496 [Candidatus Azotimanducaceae bacterium]|jgi:hypothetical protein
MSVTVNMVMAYGACCVVPDSPEVDNGQATVAPCHQVEDTDPPQSGEHCCLTYVSIISIEVPLQMVSLTTAKVASVGSESSLSSGIDPPFRPPINHLS